MRQEQPNREDDVRVYIDTDTVKGWYVSKRDPGDRPEKKHLIFFRDEDGNMISHAWMTAEHLMKMRLERRV